MFQCSSGLCVDMASMVGSFRLSAAPMAAPFAGCMTLQHAVLYPACRRASDSDPLAGFHKEMASLSRRRWFSQAVSDTANTLQPNFQNPETTDDSEVPTPIVVIDQEADPDATVVELSFGNRLGALLDTMQALKELGLNVVSSRISVEGPVTRKRFAITQVNTGRKIEDPEMLEAIRLTIISNMLEYHPESSAYLALGNAFGVKAPTQLDVDIATHIRITDEGSNRSLLYIETADRPGLLREIVKVITDINVLFEYGEFDTEGLLAKAKFHVNYRGAALNKSLKQVLTNSLHYYLRRPETNEDSY